MIEIGCVYSKPEMSLIFGTKDTQGLSRKLVRYGIDYEMTGRGERAAYTIKGIADPFKVFAITELGFDANTDFYKLRNFYYHYFEDEIFMALPDEVKEVRMREMGQPVSRQTIANYTRRLECNNLISRNTNNFIYYFAYKQTQIFVGHDEYVQAWREYWENINEHKMCSFDAIALMRAKYGGVARKQPIPGINGIYNNEIEYMLQLIQISYENEME